jgi:glycerol-3-phosphate dehydrogenase
LPDYTLREIVFLVQHEKICHLDDFLLRRSMLAMLGRVEGEMLEDLARIIGNALGWNEEQKTAEVNRTLSILRERHGLILPDEQRNQVSESKDPL